MVVGAGAKVLGNLQVGNNVRIGAGSVVLRDVPKDCTVVGVPGRIVYRGGAKVNPLDHGGLPDSEAQVIRYLMDRIEVLEREVKTLKGSSCSIPETVAEALEEAVGGSSSHTSHTSCRLQDKAVEQFLDGTGI